MRPKPFEVYTADVLRTDEHTSPKMPASHLNDDDGLSP